MGFFKTISREASTMSVLLKLKKWTEDLSPEGVELVPDDFERVVDKYPNNAAFRFEGSVTSYAEFDARANRIANWALGKGLKAGDVVAVYMENCADYVAVWFGLSKIGVVSALINHNLSGEALAHCINIADAKLVISSENQDEGINSVAGRLEGDPKVWTLGGQVGEDLNAALVAVPKTRPLRTHREHLRGRDLCLYVYTSGTTGLPKAARLPHYRVQGMMRTFIAPTSTTSRDRVYLPLPLYHGTGGICGVGIALMTGACLIIRRRFSASQYWDDVTDQGATVIVYIGELCRYLMNQPPHPKERAHRIRTGFGNGLRPDIWEAFHERFNIPRLAEFYGSTEGNVSMMNFDGTVGAVGRMPNYLKNTFAHVAFVKFDVVEEAPVRGEDGFCIRADDDEAGEVLGRIGEEVRTRFEGYNDDGATQKKLLRDVFEPGDMWFRTGDLMKKDAEGYVYFVDRIGDTFRWKGENVSTNEVAEIFAKAPGVATANVYGVEVPRTDGRAGMAAITTKGDVDFANLYSWLEARLPKYAIPLFVRIQKQAETTGTFKYRKVDLVNDGFDPNKVEDPIWYFDPEAGKYEPLTQDAYDTLQSGAVKF
ncbi:MAG: long-chain-acyl-CoA synthetase [Henriciella sp.]|nr:long-chain-acyl-CoA synthetase [Henriciella sp.]